MQYYRNTWKPFCEQLTIEKSAWTGRYVYSVIQKTMVNKDNTVPKVGMCTLTKYYIHICKRTEKPKTTKGLDEFIQSIIQLEREIANQQKSLLKFTTKWDYLG